MRVFLSSLDNFSGFKATGANANALSATAYKCADRLKIRVKATVGTIIGVADLVTELRSLATHVTTFRHSGYTSS